jgi:hypothetical protein
MCIFGVGSLRAREMADSQLLNRGLLIFRSWNGTSPNNVDVRDLSFCIDLNAGERVRTQADATMNVLASRQT